MVLGYFGCNCGAMLSVFLITGMNDLLAINRTDSSRVKIEIPENPTLDDVAATLEKNGIINEPSYFKMFATITKSADDFTQVHMKSTKYGL